MLKAIKELGQYIRENKNLDDVQVLTESSKLANTKKMICVVFKRENDSLIFDGVHIEDFDQEKARKVLYKPIRGGNYDAFLTSIITARKEDEEAIENVKNRWKKWLNEYCQKFTNVYFIKLLKNSIEKNKDKIFNEILEKYSGLKKEEKRNCLLIVKIKKEEDTGEMYPADIPEFVEIFSYTWFESLFSKYKEIAKGNGICAFCGREDEVMPASPFAVFTVKKVGFAYYFDRQNSWKQLPICGKCALDLQVGKEWIMDKEKLNLSFTLYGYRYFVIPNFIFKDFSEEILTELELRKSEDYRDGLLNAEDDILEIVKERKDVLSLIFVFYKVKQQYFDIIRCVEEVSPSWIKRIYDTFRNINQKSIFKEDQLKAILGEKWSGNFREGKGMWNGKAISKLNLAGMIGEFSTIERKIEKCSINLV